MVDRRKVCLVILLISFFFFRAANRRGKTRNKLRILTDARRRRRQVFLVLTFWRYILARMFGHVEPGLFPYLWLNWLLQVQTEHSYSDRQSRTIQPTLADQNRGKLLERVGWQVQIANKQTWRKFAASMTFFICFIQFCSFCTLVLQNTSWPLAVYVLIRSVCALILNL